MPSEIPQDWFLTNDMIAAAREKVNATLGARRMLSHAIFTPGYPGWLEEVDRDKSAHPWASTTRSSCTRSTSAR